MQTLDSVGEKVELNDGEIFQEINPAVAVVIVQLTSAGEMMTIVILLSSISFSVVFVCRFMTSEDIDFKCWEIFCSARKHRISVCFLTNSKRTWLKVRSTELIF